MRLAIKGALGNMGKRYCSVLDYLDIPYFAYDKGDEIEHSKFTHLLVTIPTEYHFIYLRQLLELKTPLKILCEKPIAVIKDEPHWETFDTLLRDYENSIHSLYMVNQYAYYCSFQEKEDETGPTEYKFYNSGKDGLIWDCIQLVHLAKGSLCLSKSSPIWQCRINRVQLDREQIDLCYVKMLKDFTSDGKEYSRLWGVDDIRKAHKKALILQRFFNSSASEIYVDTIAQQV